MRLVRFRLNEKRGSRASEKTAQPSAVTATPAAAGTAIARRSAAASERMPILSELAFRELREDAGSERRPCVNTQGVETPNTVSTT